ncbi:hypothetical protein B0H17DRAFT_216185 [Mycena rosella]|uniref:Uncharacterized protein n=1 Tax=Mycena rosella TaxID=1033263 RepID=A0AAD7CXM4_MYCRO|nr:hypothetical protein B0H17DRAFT_216185 [Mycena rosella]
MSMARSRQAPLVKTAAPIVHAEDSQPNESIGKRRAIPSLVVPSQPPSRNDRKQWMNKRGGYQNPTGNYGESSSASGSRRGPYPTPIPPPRSAPTRDNPPYIPPIQTVHYPAAPPSFNRFAGPSNFRRSSLNNSSIFTPAPVHFMQTAAPPERESTLSMPIRAYPQIPFFAAGPSNIPTENTFNRPPPNPSSTAQPAPPRRPPPAVARVPSPHPSSTSTSASINSTDPTPAPQPAAAPSEQPTLGSPPPHKRRRVDEPTIKTEDAPVSLPRAPPPAPRDSSPPPTPQIKLEPRTPSPPPSPPPRRSATSGSKRYFPVPYDCTRASIDPEFVTNRRKWARSECGVLRDLGLKVAKFFFRAGTTGWS